MNVDHHTKIAFLGMGLMGSRMAIRLLQAGFKVAVWNRTTSACDVVIDIGATALDLHNIADYPVILTCLANDAAAQAVYDQIQAQLRANQVIVDFSSLSVDKTKSLAQAAQTRQVQWIDSPVSGGTIGAEQGTLVIFAGGDRQTIQDLSLIYNVLSQRVTCMGDTGTGQATKICNQLIVAANSTLIAEAVALAAHAGVDTTLLAPALAGVDTTLLAPALAGGFADSKPLQILTPRMATHTFEPVQWKVQTLTKDLNHAVQLAEHFNLKIPVAKQALLQLQTHQNKGYAEADLATVIQLVES